MEHVSLVAVQLAYLRVDRKLFAANHTSLRGFLYSFFEVSKGLLILIKLFNYTIGQGNAVPQVLGPRVRVSRAMHESDANQAANDWR